MEGVHVRHSHQPGWLRNSLERFNFTTTTQAYSSSEDNVTSYSYLSEDNVTTTYSEESYLTTFTSQVDTALNLSVLIAHSPAPVVDHTVGIYVACFLILCCAVSLVVNVIILASACFMRARVNNTLYISLSLAAADTFSLFFLGLVLFLFALLPRFGVYVEAPCLYLLVEALRMGAIMTNMFHLAALACNHYLGILLPLRLITRRNIQYGIVVLWTVPSSLLVLDMLLLETDQQNKCDPRFLAKAKFRTRFSIPFFTTLGLMMFIYVHIYKLVCRHQTQPMDWGYRHRSSRVTKKAIVTTIMILGSTILGWLPPFTYFALYCEDCILCDLWLRFRFSLGEFVLNTTLQFLLIIKPATNFYIYAFRMKEIRGAIRRMRRRMWAVLSRSQGGGARYELTEMSLARARSRTSTFRSKTCSLRFSSNPEHTNNNGVSPGSVALRRCRSNASRYKSYQTPL